MTIKYHFYKCTIEPDRCKYYDHSKGIAGFPCVQDRPNYIGYMTIKEIEGETPYVSPDTVKTAVNKRGRYTNVTRSYNARH